MTPLGEAVCETIEPVGKWNTYCIMTMPDHIHLLTAPLDRELSVAAFLKWFKRWFNESYEAREKWRWQPGGFDRLLRTSESIHEKWNYIRERFGSRWFDHALETVAISERFCR